MIFYNCRANHSLNPTPSMDDALMQAHDEYELLYLIHGDIDLGVEGISYHMQPGDLMLIRKSESHSRTFLSTAYYERIVVSFEIDKSDAHENTFEQAMELLLLTQPLGKHNFFSAAQFPDNHWRYYLDRMCRYTDPQMCNIYLMPLLNELSEDYEKVRTTSPEISYNLVSSIISYINRHLFEDLSLEMICEQFFISKAQINRIFKKNIGSTIWNYIIIKRLFRAKEMLQNGENPTIVCEKCGFNDYSNFLKAFTKAVGISPKKYAQFNS